MFDLVAAWILYAFNVFDCFLTKHLVEISGLEIEMNKFAAFLISLGMGTFVFVKLIGGAILTLLLLFYPTSRRINIGLLFCAAIYLALAIYHIVGLWSIHAAG